MRYFKSAFTLLGLLAVLVAIAIPKDASATTALQQYQNCRLEAALEANSCYLAADGYWENKACDWAWSINNWACFVTLEKALSPATI